jgi:hypothetical protein
MNIKVTVNEVSTTLRVSSGAQGLRGATGPAGANGAAGATGAQGKPGTFGVFLADVAGSVSTADIGKLFTKNGSSPAEVAFGTGYTPLTSAQSVISVSRPFAIDASPTQAYQDVEFLAQPIVGDIIYVQMWDLSVPVFYGNGSARLEFTAGANDPANDKVQIGATISDTIDNYISVANSKRTSLGAQNLVSFSKLSGTKFRVTVGSLFPGALYNDTASVAATHWQGHVLLQNDTPSNFATISNRLSLPDCGNDKSWTTEDITSINVRSTPARSASFMNGVDAVSGTPPWALITFSQQPTNQRVRVRSHQITFGSNAVVGATLLETVQNLKARLDIEDFKWPTGNGEPTSRLHYSIIDNGSTVSLKVEQYSTHLGESNHVSENTLVDVAVADNTGAYSTTATGMTVTNADNGHVNGFVRGYTSTTAGTIQFQDDAEGIDVTLTTGVEIPVGSDAQDQANKLFAALQTAIVNSNISITQNGLNITISRIPAGAVGTWGITLNGGIPGEKSVTSQTSGTDFSLGFGQIPFGKLVSLQGSVGLFESHIQNTFKAYADITAGSYIRTAPDGKVMAIDDPNANDWATGKVSEDYLTGDDVLVEFAPIYPGSAWWQNGAPVNLAQWMQRMENSMTEVRNNVFGDSSIPVPTA